MAMKRERRMSRRAALQVGMGLTGTALLAGFLPRRGIGVANAQASVPNRFLQITLVGGWDSALATDPVIKGKARSSGYQIDYRQPQPGMEPGSVPGKPSLALGPGLVPAAAAFATIPTAFVNGIYMQVPGHEFALQYMCSGRLTLSSSRDYPAIPAILGATIEKYPQHVVIGTPLPLGDTKYTTPPLHAASFAALGEMLKGPSGHRYEAELIANAHSLIARLDNGVYATLAPEHLRDLQYWRAASDNVEKIYADRLGDGLVLDADISQRYDVDRDVADSLGLDGPERSLAAAYMLMQQDVSRYVSVQIGGNWDSHANHLAVHLPPMRRFATALGVLVADLRSTPDPAVPGQMLADTTTIMITSEFVRTPLFNLAGGTDHWSSASVIVMGRGVNDGAVIGATDVNGYALGWRDGRAVSFSEDTQLLPDHVIATILENVGTSAQADLVSEVRLDALFT